MGYKDGPWAIQYYDPMSCCISILQNYTFVEASGNIDEGVNLDELVDVIKCDLGDTDDVEEGDGDGDGNLCRLCAWSVCRSQLGLLYVVLNGWQVPRLLPRLVIVSCSRSNMGMFWE